uniref:Uncharacterized protein n=1 Tax=Strongyloides stercoralis TaxID=6248 RepID=A0AAF5DIP2_STRER
MEANTKFSRNKDNKSNPISLTEKINFFVQGSGGIEQGTGQENKAAIANQNFINTNTKKSGISMYEVMLGINSMRLDMQKILNLINEQNNKIDEQKKEINDNFKKIDIFEKKSVELMNKIKDQNKAIDNQYNLIINFINEKSNEVKQLLDKNNSNNRNILSIKLAYHLKDNEKTLLVDASENYLKELIVKKTNELLDRTIVKCYNIACKYLGLCIIEEEKTYLEHGIHLVNTRSIDKKTKNANVTYYKMIHKETFFSLDQITSQENESDTNME